MINIIASTAEIFDSAEYVHWHFDMQKSLSYKTRLGSSESYTWIFSKLAYADKVIGLILVRSPDQLLPVVKSAHGGKADFARHRE